MSFVCSNCWSPFFCLTHLMLRLVIVLPSIDPIQKGSFVKLRVQHPHHLHSVCTSPTAMRRTTRRACTICASFHAQNCSCKSAHHLQIIDVWFTPVSREGVLWLFSYLIGSNCSEVQYWTNLAPNKPKYIHSFSWSFIEIFHQLER